MRVGEQLQQLKFEIVSLGSSSSVCRRGSDDDGAAKWMFSNGHRPWLSHSLRLCVLAHLRLEVFDGLERLGVAVSTFYERCSLALQYALGSLNVGIDETDNLESGS
jgi:hypothetical protein